MRRTEKVGKASLFTLQPGDVVYGVASQPWLVLAVAEGHYTYLTLEKGEVSKGSRRGKDLRFNAEVVVLRGTCDVNANPSEAE